VNALRPQAQQFRFWKVGNPGVRLGLATGTTQAGNRSLTMSRLMTCQYPAYPQVTPFNLRQGSTDGLDAPGIRFQGPPEVPGDCPQSPWAPEIKLEVEYDARLVLETVLTAARGVVEASVKIIDLGWPERDGTRMIYCDVHASASRERKGIARGSLGKHNPRHLLQVPIHIGVRSTDEDMAKRPDFSGSDPDLRTEQIGEQVALDVGAAAEGADAAPWSGGEGLRVAAVALQVHLDAQIFGEVEVDCATASIQTVAFGVDVAGVVTSIAVVHRHLKLGGVLGHRSQPKQHNNRYE
jgi:hypothetical protein